MVTVPNDSGIGSPPIRPYILRADKGTDNETCLPFIKVTECGIDTMEAVVIFTLHTN